MCEDDGGTVRDTELLQNRDQPLGRRCDQQWETYERQMRPCLEGSRQMPGFQVVVFPLLQTPHMLGIP